jgi:uncharacterized protein YbgA (DUF1722 family)
MERVRIYNPRGGPPARNGRGLFAEALLGRFPNLPVEEEGRLHDPRLRENWIERVFAYHRLLCLWATDWTIGDLVKFHTVHKFVVLAHSQKAYRDLGRMVAGAKSMPRDQLRAEYETRLMTAMKRVAGAKGNGNVLLHILGFFKKDLDTASRHELLETVEDYRRGLVPLVVPITLIRHHVRLLEIEYLRDQVYLNPHPKELALRNHV